ncbi:MAG: type II secretion system protein M [Endozoicomonas sp. (ex Botrylloides leachii)]|nr:type II secretion system protein M [Endozoicomonas sp. (ex Botrylloides leachii)]
MIQKIKVAVAQSPVVQQLRARYEQLAPRNQNILLGLAVFTAIIVFYMWVWSPLSQWSENQVNRYEKQVKIHAWLQKHINEVKGIENRKKSAVGKKELPAVVSQVAKQFGVSTSRIHPDKKGLSIWVEDAAYQKVLAWLISLEKNNRVVVQQLKLERLQEEGRIKCFIHLDVDS